MAERPDHLWDTGADPFSDLKTLVRIAAEGETTIRVRGSLAEAFLGYVRSDQGRDPAKSPILLVDLLPPFSDIDLVVESPEKAEFIRKAISSAIPFAHFFHWDIRTEADVKEYAKYSTLVLSNQPSIKLLKKPAGGVSSSTPQLWYCPRQDEYSFQNASNGAKLEIEIVRRRRNAGVAALIDVLYLARRHPQLLDDPLMVTLSAMLKEWSGNPAIQLKNSKLCLRLEYELLKLLLSSTFSRTHESVVSLVGQGLLERLARVTFNRLLGRLFAYYWNGLDLPFVAISVPRRTSKEWRGRLSVFSVDEGEQLSLPKPELSLPPKLLEWLGEDQSIERDRQVPVALVKCAPPPEPGCCRYKDFSRGVLEIAWRNPDGGKTLGASSVVPASYPGRGDFMFVHSHGMVGKTSFLRLDYNFLSVVAGLDREMIVVATARRQL